MRVRLDANLTDREIVRRVLHGEIDQFSQLVSAHAPRMMNLAVSMLHRRDAAEDVVQEAMVKAFEKLGSWRGDSAFSTWLHRIVYTTAVSAMRRRNELSEDPANATRSLYLTDSEDENAWETTEENIARMRRAIDLLSPIDRTLVLLFHLEERSVREVAEICGESESNVKTRLHRARTRLKKLMNDEKR